MLQSSYFAYGSSLSGSLAKVVRFKIVHMYNAMPLVMSELLLHDCIAYSSWWMYNRLLFNQIMHQLEFDVAFAHVWVV